MSTSQSPTTSVANEHDRKAFITSVFADKLGLEVEEIKPMGEGTNTFVHTVKIKSARLSAPTLEIPGVVALPQSLPTTLVVRVTNPESQMGIHVSMAKEVAALALVRQGAPQVPVPDVYAWSADKDWGYMVLQHLPGTAGLTVYKDASLETKAKLAPHFAKLLKDLQSIPIPEWTHPFGGFGFDQNGQIVTGPHPLGYGGPYKTVFDYQRGMLDSQLVMADANKIAKGWHANGLRERIEAFRASSDGLEKVTVGLAPRPTFSHFDLDVMNLLIDPETMTITGVVDFELAHVGLVSDEFFDGLGYLGHFHPGPYDSSLKPLKEHGTALLYPATGFADTVPMEGKAVGPANWATMRAFELAFAEKDVQRPRTIRGFEEASRLYWFCQELCPWYFDNPGWVAKADIKKELAGNAERMGLALKHWGF